MLSLYKVSDCNRQQYKHSVKLCALNVVARSRQYPYGIISRYYMLVVSEDLSAGDGHTAVKCH